MKEIMLTVLGSINVDHVISVSHFVTPGETLQGKEYNIAYGGKGANQAVACARLKTNNLNVQFLGCVGHDAIGKEIKEALVNEGLQTSSIQIDKDNLTGIAFIQVDSKGENSIVISSGANASVNAQYVEQHTQEIIKSDYLLMQLETPLDAIEKASELAKKYQVKVILNPAPAQKLPNKLLQQIDVITPNETEAEILSGIKVYDKESAQKAANFFHKNGVELVLITLGAKGVFCSEKGKGKGNIISGFKVEPVDTTAAGDTFNGAFVCALTEGKSIEEAIIFGNAAGALSVTKHGAQPSIPNRCDVKDFITKSIKNS